MLTQIFKCGFHKLWTVVKKPKAAIAFAAQKAANFTRGVAVIDAQIITVRRTTANGTHSALGGKKAVVIGNGKPKLALQFLCALGLFPNFGQIKFATICRAFFAAVFTVAVFGLVLPISVAVIRSPFALVNVLARLAVSRSTVLTSQINSKFVDRLNRLTTRAIFFIRRNFGANFIHLARGLHAVNTSRLQKADSTSPLPKLRTRLDGLAFSTSLMADDLLRHRASL